MIQILLKQFYRSKTIVLIISIFILLGCISLVTGKQFLNQKQQAIQEVTAQQKKHIKTQTSLHKDDLGLLMYYLKFSFVKPLSPIAGISIGVSDINSQIQNVSILNLEGQKYNTDLTNPMRLQVGNLDISFLLISLLPLLIIALTFNVLSEEIEKGTWKMLLIQGNTIKSFLIKKLLVRFVFVILLVIILLIASKFVFQIPFKKAFINTIFVSLLYVFFWFLVSTVVILLKKSSATNAIILLVTWLLLVVFLPVLCNNYISYKYPVDEAFSMTIKQRDEYHKRWDTNKAETMNLFYKHYPQFSKYTVKEKGFSWIWYYAMQQMGDDASVEEREAMYKNINDRLSLSKTIAKFVPTLQLQFTMNALAETSLEDQLNFLNSTTKFHEDLRLSFYPKIFENKKASSVNWDSFKPEVYLKSKNVNIFNELKPILIASILLLLTALGLFKKV